MNARESAASEANPQPAATATNPSPWLRAALVDELRGDGPYSVSAGGVDLVVVRSKRGLLDPPKAGQERLNFLAYEGRCPHQGALLGEGELDGDVLVCRNHRWRFEIENGQRVGGAQCLRPCPVRQEGRELLVDVRALKASLSAQPEKSLRSIDELPSPPGLPLLGNVFQMDVDRLHQVLEGWAKQYGTPYMVRIGYRRVIVICDPTVIAEILRARPDAYRRISQIEPIFEEIGLGGVFSAEGISWRSQRRLAVGALSHRHLRDFYPALEAVAERLLRRWRKAAEQERELDIADELKRFTVDVTTQLVFGQDLNTLERDDEDLIQSQLQLVFPALQRRVNALIPYWRFFRLPRDRRLDKAVGEVRRWLERVVRDARAELARDPGRAEKPANFLEAMLTARDDAGNPFSDEIIFGNGLTMLLAGEDTTAYTLAWAIHHLCDEPAAVRSLRAEVDFALGPVGHGPCVPTDIDQANQLAYCTAVANEAMRLRPVAPVALLEPNYDVVAGDVALPKGVGVALLTRPLALEASHFSEPLAFVPERWIEGGDGARAHDPSAHIPFGSGPRICPGRTLALLEMRVVLATLYRNFDVERVGHSADVTEFLAFTMAPANLRVRLHARVSAPAQ